MSKVNGCEYCSHDHAKVAKKAGVSVARIAAIDEYTGSVRFDDYELVVLHHAEQLTSRAEVDDAVAGRLKNFLDDRQPVTRTATAALANCRNWVNHGLDVELS